MELSAIEITRLEDVMGHIKCGIDTTGIKNTGSMLKQLALANMHSLRPVFDLCVHRNFNEIFVRVANIY